MFFKFISCCELACDAILLPSFDIEIAFWLDGFFSNFTLSGNGKKFSYLAGFSSLFEEGKV